MNIRNDIAFRSAMTDFQRRGEPNFAWAKALSVFSLLPGIRGFWPMSNFDTSGNALDLGGNGRTLTYNGNPVYNTYGLAPYIKMDAVGDSLSRADEAELDITGTEAFVAGGLKGLTIGGWFWFDAFTTARVAMAKWKVTGSDDRSYRIYWSQVLNAFACEVSSDGTAVTSVPSTAGYGTGAWYFIAGRFFPSAELAIFVNKVKDVNVTAIPASIYSGAANFYIGTQDAGSTFMMNGLSSLCFLCASALPDGTIRGLYEQTRALYGVG